MSSIMDYDDVALQKKDRREGNSFISNVMDSGYSFTAVALIGIVVVVTGMLWAFGKI